MAPLEAAAAPGDGSGSALTNSSEGAALKAWRTKQNKGGDSLKSRSSTRAPSGPTDKQRLAAIEKQTNDFIAYSNRKRAFDACTSAGTGG